MMLSKIILLSISFSPFFIVNRLKCIGVPALHKSRIYSFLDNKAGFVWHFFEGQRVIADLAILHSLKESGFTYYRDLVLSSIPMINFLKPGEQFGFYIDSDNPFFKFKIEAGHHGQFRTIILPKDFNLFPDKLDGISRFSKILPSGNPYNSIIELKQTSTGEIVNEIIKSSYQTEAKIILSELTDQSLLVLKLPDLNPQLEVGVDLDSYIKAHHSFTRNVFEKDHNDIEKIVKDFEANDIAYMSSKQIEFHCPCSLENMQEGIRRLSLTDLDDIFKEQDPIEVSCDYCNKAYQVSKESLKQTNEMD